MSHTNKRSKPARWLAGLAATVVAAASAVQAQPAPPMAEGEVRKIDREQGKVTLRHGPIVTLDMPGMTMVFRAATPELLNGLKEGDKVKFSVTKVQGAYTVTAIEPLR